MATNVVLCAAAGFCGEATGSGDEALPGFASKAWQVFGHNILPDKGAGKAGIETVACTNGTHYISNGRHKEIIAARGGTNRNLLRSCRTDEIGTVVADIYIIYMVSFAGGEHHFKIFGAATHNGAFG